MARTRARLAIGATGRHRSQQSHRRGHRRLALLVRARVLFLTAWQTSRLWLPAQIERLSIFESSRHCRASSGLSERIFRSASSWILASAYTPAASSISPTLSDGSASRAILVRSPPPKLQHFPQRRAVDRSHKTNDSGSFYRRGVRIFLTCCPNVRFRVRVRA